MEIKVAGAEEGVTALINWGRFSDASYLDEVELEYETRPLSIEHGTRLYLMNLRKKETWREEDFQAVHDRLSRLLSPFGEINDFTVELDIPAFPNLTGKVEPHPLTQRPRYMLSGKLDSDGRFSGSVQANGRSVKSFSEHRIATRDESVKCGPFDIEIRAWDRDRPGLAPYMMEFQLGIQDVRRILNTFSGVSIYRDGFRVHPYGEPGDDWLRLDNRSRQVPTTRLANNQIIAAVRISRKDNPGLVDRTTREGLVKNAEYEALTDWVVRILALLEDQRYRLRPREEPDETAARTLFEVFDLTSVVEASNRQLGHQHPITKLVTRSDADIRDGVRKLQEHYSRILMAAGLGQMVDLVIHEMGAPIGRANRELAYLEKKLTGKLTTDQINSVTDIKMALEHLVSLRNRLDPKAAGKRGRDTTFDMYEEVEGNLRLFENLIKHQGIEVSVHAPIKDPIIVHMMRAAAGQIVANLLDNSIHWLTRHHGDGKGGRIDIQLLRIRRGFRLVQCDDGPGVPSEDRERVFDPYFSTKPNGMGLGLYIARQVIEPYGKLFYRDDCELPGACFEALFDHNVGL
jgi:signal transduction histidine kinase